MVTRPSTPRATSSRLSAGGQPCWKTDREGERLHLFAVEYGDRGDPHRRSWHTYAYDRDHAAERFDDSNWEEFDRFGVTPAKGCSR